MNGVNNEPLVDRSVDVETNQPAELLALSRATREVSSPEAHRPSSVSDVGSLPADGALDERMGSLRSCPWVSARLPGRFLLSAVERCSSTQHCHLKR